MASQTYTLTGVTDFMFPFNVRFKSELTLATLPGGIVPPQAYEVIGAGPNSTFVVVRWPDAPAGGFQQLVISRTVPVQRVTEYVNDEAVTAEALNDEVDNIYRLLGEAKDLGEANQQAISNVLNQVIDNSTSITEITNQITVLQQIVEACCGSHGGGGSDPNEPNIDGFDILFDSDVEGAVYAVKAVAGTVIASDTGLVGTLDLAAPPFTSLETDPIGTINDPIPASRLFPGPDLINFQAMTFGEMRDYMTDAFNAISLARVPNQTASVSTALFDGEYTMLAVPNGFIKFQVFGPAGTFATAEFVASMEEALVSNLEPTATASGLDVPTFQTAIGAAVADNLGLSGDWTCTGIIPQQPMAIVSETTETRNANGDVISSVENERSITLFRSEGNDVVVTFATGEIEIYRIEPVS